MDKWYYFGHMKRRFAGMLSRTSQRVKNNLGKIRVPLPEDAEIKLRKPMLEMYDAYYESRQYDHLLEWDETKNFDGTYVPVRNRKPRLLYNFSAVLVSRLTSKLIGEQVFPKFRIEEDPETENYLKFIIKAADLKSKLLEPIRRELIAGACLVRFYVINGKFKIEHYLSKYCYPVFSPDGELEQVEIKYVYSDENDKDEKGNPKLKWYRLILGKMEDTLYNNPEYKENQKDIPFMVDNIAKHGLGFVQAEWFRTSDEKNSVDGYSVIEDILDFIDELNYSLSQSSQAVGYNQDPQIMISGMDEEEIDALIRSASKAWNLGKEGKAAALETNMNGVQVAMAMRDKVRLHLQDIARIVLLDPEKAVGHAQSAKAMEVLHGPMIELIDELRAPLAKNLQDLVLKLAITNLILVEHNESVPVTVPEGYKPQSFNIEIVWSPIFPLTMTDLQQKISLVSQAVTGNLISRETGMRYIAKDFGIEDLDEEMQKILSQPAFNPFGGGWMPGIGEQGEEQNAE